MEKVFPDFYPRFLNNLFLFDVIIYTSRSGMMFDLDDMATFKDPTQCFAPLEVVERLLEIRKELGFAETVYLDRSEELTDFLDAYGFDIYAFSTKNEKINYGDYRAPVVPGGDAIHASEKNSH